ncbi:MAG: septal ring lytic transglycosylase RlpA family protein [Ideonella sp.]
MTTYVALSSPFRSARMVDGARAIRLLTVVGMAVLLVACASSGSRRSASARPGAAPSWETDGPGLSPPADLASIPDAEPSIEPMRSGAMRPYEVQGRTYTPITEDVPLAERGLASWYGRKFQGRATASGERYDMYAMTAAHPTLPLPSYVRVRNPANQREVIVRINDRGPFHPGRIIDLSYTAAWKLDLLRGVAPVEIERITNREILAGSWRRGTQSTLIASRGTTRAAPIASAAAISAPTNLAQPMPVPIAAPSAKSITAPISAPITAPAAAPIVAPATAQVPVVVAALPPSVTTQSTPMTAGESSGYWVQLGAFRYRDGAESFQRQVVADLAWIAPALSVRSDAQLHRLQAGPYAERDQATDVAQRLRESLQLVPVIVERR